MVRNVLERAMARRGRKPPKITAAWLERVTAFYLERYSTTSSHLRRLLKRRVDRIVRETEGDRDAAHALVDAEVDRLVRVRAIDDEAWARDRARSLRRRGASTLRVRKALAEKGLRGDAIGVALAGDPDEPPSPDADFLAAQTYAKKRRIGPWREGEADRERVRKELVRLGRAGFSYAIARRVLGGDGE